MQSRPATTTHLAVSAYSLSTTNTKKPSSSPQNQITHIINKCISLLQSSPSSKSKLNQIHGFSIRHGVPIQNPDMGKHLIYYLISLSSSHMAYAHNIFSQIQNPNIFAWNTMIRGYAESGNPKPAVDLYNEMYVSNSVVPDTHTYPFVFKAIAKLTDVRLGEKLHSIVVRNGFDSLIFVQNSMLHFYANIGYVESAYKVFDKMPERDLVAWNSVINGFALNGRPNEALTLFKEMGSDKVDPDGFTMVSLLSACSELNALALGRRVHVYMMKIGWVRNWYANNALLDLYAKCGNIRDAQRVFNEMKDKDVVSWTSLIVGLALNGFGEEAIDVFKVMEKKHGLIPSEVTFVGVLYACSHCGLVDEGFDYFKRMSEEFRIDPKIEHYGCMVDLLGRAGLVEKAYDFIQNMPLKPNAIVWRMLLGACTIHGHLGLGEYARTRIDQLEPNHSGDYVLLSNLYATEQRWSDAQNVRKKMVNEGVKKYPGHSLVELGNNVHEFLMGDKSHPQTADIYEMLGDISTRLKLEGYVPKTSNVFVDIEEEEKENVLSYHSEKIAIAFMLLNTVRGMPIRVVKNLRVCGDCHLAIKLISKVYDREIVVRDRSRFHHFKNGCCSCKDYW